MAGIGMKMKDAKTLFLDSPAVLRAVDQAERKSFNRSGGYIRTVARNSIKRPPAKKKKDLTAAEEAEYQKELDEWKDGGKQGPRPKRGLRQEGSPPGKPPYFHTKLIKLIFFVYDPRKHSVVVGPVKKNTVEDDDELEMLEYGGRTTRRGRPSRYRARPFMRPALAAEEDRVADRWKNSLKG